MSREPLGLVSKENEIAGLASLPGRAANVRNHKRSVTDRPKDSDGRDTSSLLKLEVEALRARLARRDETISKLKSRVDSDTATQGIAEKLENLVQRHKEAKSKHRSELDAALAANAALRNDLESQRVKESASTGKLTDLRSKLALSEAESAKLRQELVSRPPAHTGPSDERIAWNKAKSGLESEVRRLEKEVERGTRKALESEARDKANVGMKAENERLKFGWTVMAEQYGELYNTLQAVQRDNHERHLASTQSQADLEGVVERLEGQVARYKEDRRDMCEQLDLLRGHNKAMRSDFNDQVALRAADLAWRPIQGDADVAPPDLVAAVSHEEAESLLDLANAHSQICSVELQERQSHIARLTTRIIDLEQSVHDADIRVNAVETTHSRLMTDHEALRAEHAPCGATLSQVRFELDQANQMVDNRGEEVNDVRMELCRVSERSDRQGELLQRANENVLRSKFAQDALEEEVERLQTNFIEAAGFEERYHDLLERQELLETREAVAIEQAERVAQENAELMGHTSGSQKIGYVDGIRREIAMSRQELAATRHHLNVANDRIVSLENEIAAYKTISPESALNASRTRVVRRQPEGGRLTSSVSASGVRKISVTGPGGAKRII